MALYTQLNTIEIQGILDDYGLGPVLGFNPLSGGSENSNYLVNTPEGKFVLTICEQKSLSDTNKLAKILIHLNENNFKTSKVIHNLKHQVTSTFNKKPILIKEFLEGIVTEDISVKLMHLLGIELGKLHKIKIPKSIKQKTCYDKEQFYEVSQYAPQSSFNQWLQNIKVFIDTHIDESAPRALIHSDLFPSNVVISNNQSQVTIMDFEEAAHYYRMFDVGMTIVGSCRQGNKVNIDKIKALMAGYKTQIEMELVEYKTLQAFTVYAGAAMTFWRHKNFHYTNPDPNLFNHYKELLNVTEYIKSLPSKIFM